MITARSMLSRNTKLIPPILKIVLILYAKLLIVSMSFASGFDRKHGQGFGTRAKIPRHVPAERADQASSQADSTGISRYPQPTRGKRLEKVRYRIPLGELTVELDVYFGKPCGLTMAEVEFDTDGQLRSFQPPEWLGREVTGRDEFSNSRLAARAEPPVLRKS